MDVRQRRAAAVGFTGSGMEALEAALEACGCAAYEAQDAADGLRLIERLQPELAVIAAILPGTDGVAFVRRARRLRLEVRPALLVLRPPGLRLPGGAELAALEATVADLPPSVAVLRAALDGSAAALPPRQAARLAELLDDLGVPEHRGRDCLARAVALVWRDRRRLYGMKANLYPELARQTGLSPAQAERAMRHAIEAAWRTGALEPQHRIFGDTIDARRGKPTCGEMIAQLAEELRWEG